MGFRGCVRKPCGHMLAAPGWNLELVLPCCDAHAFPCSYIVSAGVVEGGPDGFMQVVEAHDPRDSARRVMAFAKDVLRVAQQVGALLRCLREGGAWATWGIQGLDGYWVPLSCPESCAAGVQGSSPCRGKHT